MRRSILIAVLVAASTILLISPFGVNAAQQIVSAKEIHLRPNDEWNDLYRFESHRIIVYAVLGPPEAGRQTLSAWLRCEEPHGTSDDEYVSIASIDVTTLAYQLLPGSAFYGHCGKYMVELVLGPAVLVPGQAGQPICQFISLMVRVIDKEFGENTGPAYQGYTQPNQGSNIPSRSSEDQRANRSISAGISEMQLSSSSLDAGQDARLTYAVTNWTSNPSVNFKVVLNWEVGNDQSSGGSKEFTIGCNQIWESGFTLSMPRPGGFYTDGSGVSRPGKGPAGRTVQGKATLNLYEARSLKLIDTKTVYFSVRGQ